MKRSTKAYYFILRSGGPHIQAIDSSPLYQTSYKPDFPPLQDRKVTKTVAAGKEQFPSQTGFSQHLRASPRHIA